MGTTASHEMHPNDIIDSYNNDIDLTAIHLKDERHFSHRAGPVAREVCRITKSIDTDIMKFHSIRSLGNPNAWLVYRQVLWVVRKLFPE